MRILISVMVFLAVATSAFAWENHDEITKLSLQGFDKWEDAPFEPIEKALPDLNLGGVVFSSRESFSKALEIRGEKLGWDDHEAPIWAKSSGRIGTSIVSRGADILAWSSMTPDGGMDQELDLGPDQEFMGGKTGPSSQGIRHMFYQAFDWKQPLITFHYPAYSRSLGQAHDRAQIFFDLAMQAKRTKHWFWAYRFLGICLHYIEDLNQPYHSQQFGSVVLLPIGFLLRGGNAFIAETTRIVGNFHLTFERYTVFLLHRTRPGLGGKTDSTEEIDDVFQVPRASPLLKDNLEAKEAELSVRDGAVFMARAGAMLAPQVVGGELGFMGDELLKPSLNLISGFLEVDGTPKIRFENYITPKNEEAKKRKSVLIQGIGQALSNTGVSVRWVFDKFRLGR